MANNNRLLLTRDQLAAFLPDHQAVKQFEDLFKQVSQLTPVEIDYLAAILGSGRTFNSDSLRVAVNQMALTPPTQQRNLDFLVKRLEIIEQQPPKKQNLNSLENRLFAIEAFLGLPS